MSRVDAVIVTYNGAELVPSCIEALRKSTEPINVVVVDNHSTDGSAGAARRAGADNVIENDTNLGFGTAVNRGVAAGEAAYVLLVNSDAQVSSSTVGVLADALDAHSDVCAVGPRIEAPDGALELSTGRTMTLGNEAWFKFVEGLGGESAPVLGGGIRRDYDRDRDVESLTAACLMLRRDAFQRVNGFDEDFFLYAEDVDLCRRLRAGGCRLRYVAATTVRHLRGASAREVSELTQAAYRHSQRHFYAKHHGPLARATLRCYLELKAFFGSMRGSESGRHLRRWLRDGGPRPGATP